MLPTNLAKPCRQRDARPAARVQAVHPGTATVGASCQGVTVVTRHDARFAGLQADLETAREAAADALRSLRRSRRAGAVDPLELEERHGWAESWIGEVRRLQARLYQVGQQ